MFDLVMLSFTEITGCAQEFEEGAREVCERVEIPPGTTVPGLDRRLQKLTAEITAAEES